MENNLIWNDEITILEWLCDQENINIKEIEELINIENEYRMNSDINKINKLKEYITSKL